MRTARERLGREEPEAVDKEREFICESINYNLLNLRWQFNMIIQSTLKNYSRLVRGTVRVVSNNRQDMKVNNRFLQNNIRCFSAENSAEAAKDEPSKEEIEKGRSEWGIKYSDEALKFEKEWKEIADKIEDE